MDSGTAVRSFHSFCVCVVVDCQADFDVDNVQRRELVNFYGV